MSGLAPTPVWTDGCGGSVKTPPAPIWAASVDAAAVGTPLTSSRAELRACAVAAMAPTLNSAQREILRRLLAHSPVGHGRTHRSAA